MKGARHHSGRGQEPSVLRARHGAVGCLAQAADHLRRVGVRMGVRMDRDQPRIRGGGRSCAIGGVHNQLASVRAGARPPRARGGDPQQVVVQVAIACRARLLGDRDQIGHPRIVNQRARIQELADPARSRDLQGVEIEALDLAQHRDRDVRSPALKGQLGGGEHATGPVVWGAELHRSPQRGQGDVDRASAPGAHPGLFELTRKLLVRPGHQRGSVPHAAVRIGLERRGERLMYAATLLHAGALPDRGANQRVSKTDRVDVEVDERRPGGRLKLRRDRRESRQPRSPPGGSRRRHLRR